MKTVPCVMQSTVFHSVVQESAISVCPGRCKSNGATLLPGVMIIVNGK